MSTVSKNIADEVILYDGLYPGDFVRVVKIVKYQNCFNGCDAYGMIYERKRLDMYCASEFVINPETYWEYAHG